MCVCVCMHAWYSLFQSVCTRGRGLWGWLHANTHIHTPRTWSFCANSSALVFPFASSPPLSSTQSGKRKKSASSPYSARPAAHETCSAATVSAPPRTSGPQASGPQASGSQTASSPYSARPAAHETCSNAARRERERESE